MKLSRQTYVTFHDMFQYLVATTIVEAVAILTPEQEITVKVDSVTTLPCVATGMPVPSISWTSPDGTNITSGGIYSTDPTTGETEQHNLRQKAVLL